MKLLPRLPSFDTRRALGLAVTSTLATLVVTGTGAASGCLSRPIEPIEPATTSVLVQQLSQGGVNKIDLVLAVDNSSSMADKQQILALAVPDLIRGLVNPPCLDNATAQPIPDASQPTTATEKCPTGSTREFPPILDIHVGVLSSSLGSFGVPGIFGCTDAPLGSCPAGTTTTPGDDHGHLVTRSDSCDSAGDVATYDGNGYLAWDPGKNLSPPGITDVGDIGDAGPGSGTGIVGALHDLVVGDGQSGCGWESQDESWYRFLVDPAPYKTIAFPNNNVQTSGVDADLLKQRAEFLRPDSLLAIVVLSDETDTSVKESAYNPILISGEIPNPRTGCANGPEDKCCTSCGLPAPPGCLDPDPQCAKGAPEPMPYGSDLRAFGLISHKQRFGIEFFYPPSRYVNALTSSTIEDEDGRQVPNPIYTKYKGGVRDPSLVFYAAITGVPWQLIARQKNGVPDLIHGVSDLDPTQVGGFKTSKELAELDKLGNSYWDDVAGDPERYVPAKSPYMVEATSPRTGTDPITGTTLAPPGTANGAGPMSGGSLINDHERNIPQPPGDIEYACVFPILTPIDCSTQACDCTLGDGSPLCEPNPKTGGTTLIQTQAKAYPGIKELAIARGMGDQGIAASICAKQVTDPTQADYGYRPAMKAIVDRLKLALRNECLPRQLTPAADGQVSCLILEGTAATPGQKCSCDGTKARSEVTSDHEAAVQAALASPVGQGAHLGCFCEIDQVSNAAPTAGALTDCQTDPLSTANGWCYVDAIEGPKQASLVESCPPTERRQIRFVGTGTPQEGSTVFITCAGQ